MGFRRKVIPRLCQNLAQLPKASQKFQIFRGGWRGGVPCGRGDGALPRRSASASPPNRTAAGASLRRALAAAVCGDGFRTAAGASLRRALALAAGAGGAFLQMLRALARAVGGWRGRVGEKKKTASCCLRSGVRDEIRTHTAFLPLPPQSSVSTNSTTRTWL